jgi:thiol-disulfide isomerase/thioredoxin
MLERALLVIVLFAIGYAAYRLRVSRQIDQVSHDPLLDQLQPGIPAIIYFTTPDCIPCRTRQQPALERIRETLGENALQVLQIDATQEPDVADRWGVLSAPTTFIIDSSGQTVAVNHGVADEAKLQRQITA